VGGLAGALIIVVAISIVRSVFLSLLVGCVAVEQISERPASRRDLRSCSGRHVAPHRVAFLLLTS